MSTAPPPAATLVSTSELRAFVAFAERATGLGLGEIRSHKRHRRIAHRRFIAMTAARRLFASVTLREVGDAFGGFDYATVIHAQRRVANHPPFSDACTMLMTAWHLCRAKSEATPDTLT